MYKCLEFGTDPLGSDLTQQLKSQMFGLEIAALSVTTKDIL